MNTFKRAVVLVGVCIYAIPLMAQDWQLVWSDEFTGGISSDWVYDIGNGSSGWGNNELEYYQAANATVENGVLVITARQESVDGFSYTSSRMKTKGNASWQYGRIEARIAVPSVQGLWPAFWMLGSNIDSVGWPVCGEIDIMEHVNTESSVHGAIHWLDHNGGTASYSGAMTTTPTDYHVYAIEWDETLITWYVDGVQFHAANITDGVNGTDEFHNVFFILLNLAVGGNWPGFTIDNSALPASMYVDYVRVYQDGGSSGGGSDYTSVPGTIQAEDYSAMSGVATESTTDTGGGLNVGWIDAGDWMEYQIYVPVAGTYTINYRVASLNGGGEVIFSQNATDLQITSLPNTGGWQNWTTVSTTVYLKQGNQTYALYASAGGWNINWWSVTGGPG